MAETTGPAADDRLRHSVALIDHARIAANLPRHSLGLVKASKFPGCGPLWSHSVRFAASTVKFGSEHRVRALRAAASRLDLCWRAFAESDGGRGR